MGASAQAQSASNVREVVTPKVDVFGGYSYFDPGTALHGLLPGATLPFSECLCSVPRGAGASVTYNFNRWFGLTLDTSGHWSPHPAQIGDSAFYSVSVGPTITYRTRHFSPFAEGFVGGQRLTPEPFHHDDGFGFLAGGGLDWNLGRHFAVRLAQGDYVYSNHQFGPSPTVAPTDIRGLRLQSGLVFMFGGAPRTPHAENLPSPPVAAAAPVAAAPVKVFSPPSVTCSAVPAMVSPGGVSTISANGFSPDNRPLTYSYVVSTGSISGTGSTVSLATTGALVGEISVTCTVMDDNGRTASQNTAVTVTSPVAVARATTRNLCSISFDRDKARPARVNNEAKACLDEIALSLQQNSGAALALVGNSARGNNALASERAANTKAYLVSDKGIDHTRIDLFTGNQNSNEVSATMVPPGASFDSTGDVPTNGKRVQARR